MAETVSIGSWQWSLDDRVLRRGSEELHLTTKERALLGYLCRQIDRTVETRDLLRNVWGYAPTVKSRAVQNTVSRLRKKLGADGLQLRTVPGRGYVLGSPVDDSLVGRDDVVDALPRSLVEHRVVTLYGFGGVGKTRVARAASASFSRSMWVDVRAFVTIESLVAHVASRLGAGRAGQTLDHVGQLLAERQTALLVLDAAEHLGSSLVDVAQAWANIASSLHVLLTSRQGFTGTATYELPPLPPEASIRLLRRCANASMPPPELPPAHEAKLVELLDGIPLAIELAAARLRVVSSEELVRHLGDGFEVLEATERRLEAVIESAWESLDEDGRSVLCAAAMFPETLWVSGVQNVASRSLGRTLEALDQLRRHALLARVGRRLRLLDLVRAFVQPRIPVDIRRRFVQFAISTAQENLRTAAQREIKLVDGCPLWISALPDTADTTERAWMACAIALHDRRHGPGGRARPWLEELVPESLPPWLGSLVACTASKLAFDEDKRPRSLELAELAVQRAEHTDDMDLYLTAMNWRNGMLRMVEGLGAAIDLTEEALAICKEANGVSLGVEFGCYIEKNFCLSQLGRYEEAHRVALQLLTLTKESVGRSAIARNVLALALFKLGRHGEAIAELRTALEHAKRCNNHRLQANVGLRLGEFLAITGPAAEARQAFEDALAQARRLQIHLVLLNGRLGLAKLDHPQGALRTLEEVREHARRLGRVREVGSATHEIARVHHLLGDFETAAKHYEQAIAIFEDVGWVEPLDISHAHLALLRAEERGPDSPSVALPPKRSESEACQDIHRLTVAAIAYDVEGFTATIEALSLPRRKAVEQLLPLVARLDPAFRNFGGCRNETASWQPRIT
ncbi:MAG: winged helix-turn-helix domain-containing protein [Myxococcota bacterium]